MSDKEIRMLTKNELVAEYERTIKWYKEHNINRNFSKYAEMFWILSINQICNKFQYGIIKDCGLLVNSSRGIIYAGHDENFAQASAEKAKDLQQQMEVELSKIG